MLSSYANGSALGIVISFSLGHPTSLRLVFWVLPRAPDINARNRYQTRSGPQREFGIAKYAIVGATERREICKHPQTFPLIRLHLAKANHSAGNDATTPRGTGFIPSPFMRDQAYIPRFEHHGSKPVPVAIARRSPAARNHHHSWRNTRCFSHVQDVWRDIKISGLRLL